jgi:flagellar biosynthesis protein FlhF
MNPKRFVAANARTALWQVRAELGLDAVILSNRTIAEGAEIVAVAMSDFSALADPAMPAAAAPATGAAAPLVQKIAPPPVHTPAAAPVVAAADPQLLRLPRVPAPELLRPPRVPAPQADQPVPGSFDPRAARTQEASLLAEIRSMKTMLSEQVAGFNWSETLRHRPLRGRMLRTMLDSGFSSLLARSVIERLPDDYSADAAHEWITKVLARNLLGCAAGDITDRGGVYALVGPTGVGKTTTVAKLAARCVMKHGPSRLGLVMTDDYRIGAQDQLRIYARLLGVPLYVAQTPDDLQQALAAMAGKHLVLIDTVGIGQRDSRVEAQHDLLINAGVERLLLLNATAQAETLEQVARAYTLHKGHAVPLAGAIITKLDEAARPGCALDVAIRRRLQLHFCTSGQRVPEDLELSNPAALAKQALLKQLSPADQPLFAMDDGEASLFMASALPPLEIRT